MVTVDKVIRKQSPYFHIVQLAFMLYRKGIYTGIIHLTILDKIHLPRTMLDIRQWSFNFCHIIQLIFVDKKQQTYVLTCVKRLLCFTNMLAVSQCSPPSSMWLLWFWALAISSQCCLFCLTPSTRGSKLSDNTANDWEIKKTHYKLKTSEHARKECLPE